MIQRNEKGQFTSNTTKKTVKKVVKEEKLPALELGQKIGLILATSYILGCVVSALIARF